MPCCRLPALPPLSALIVLALWLSPAWAETGRRTDPETGAATWETSTHGVSLQLTQILPDQARAFYLNRGFPAAAAERFATACVFMTVLRNDAASGEVAFRLSDWQVRNDGRELPPLSTDQWLAVWQSMGLDEPARIAFRWAQFPPEQEYAPGEWNQGMLTTGLPPQARFDLTARWTVAGKTYEGKLEDVVCAR